MKLNKKIYIIFVLMSILVCAVIYSVYSEALTISQEKVQTASVAQAISNDIQQQDANGNQLYKGKIYHIFFHSLVIYPELAFKHDQKGRMYTDYMITVEQFKKILQSLYDKQFQLIDIHAIYGVREDGTVYKKPLYMPKGKKPLIISLDDLNYYTYMRGRGFADKLVLDADGNVATEVVTRDNKVTITRDGDVVPMIDDFVKAHPDFSRDGAKGVIALTGFQGIMGYRTQGATSTFRDNEIRAVKPVIDRLKATGWQFASHSYSHDHPFQAGKVSLAAVQIDTQKWHDEVMSLVGPTDIFIGPFGQVFKPHDARRQYLIDQGFKMLGGVGMDLYLQYFKDAVVMDRANIDGYRITHSPKLLLPYFDVKSIPAAK